jgi:hypothetical protein
MAAASWLASVACYSVAAANKRHEMKNGENASSVNWRENGVGAENQK